MRMRICTLPTQNIVCAPTLFCSVMKVFVDLKFLNFQHTALDKMGEKKRKTIDRKALKARKMVSGNKFPFYFLQSMLVGSYLRRAAPEGALGWMCVSRSPIQFRLCIEISPSPVFSLASQNSQQTSCN